MVLRWSSEVRKFLKMPPQETFLNSSMNISVQPSYYMFNSDAVHKALFEKLKLLRHRPKQVFVFS